MKTLRRFAYEDDGFAAVLLALSFVVIIGMVALVVDVGYATAVKRQAQNAADAAALSGCAEFIKTGSPTSAGIAARATGMTYVGGLMPALTTSNITVSSSFAVPNSTSVTVRYPLRTFFGGIFGRSTVNVVSTAKAQAQQLIGARNVAPWLLMVPGVPTAARYEVRNATATVASGALSQVGGVWQGSFTAPASGAYDVFVYYTNQDGVEEPVYDTARSAEATAARLFVRGAGTSVTAVSWVNPGVVNQTLFVENDGARGPRPGYWWPTVTATVAGTTASAVVRPTNPPPRELLDGLPARIGGQTVAWVYIRRPDGPVKDVKVTPLVADPGSSVTVSLVLSGFDASNWTHTQNGGANRYFWLRRSDGHGYSGDYAQADFDSVDHGSCGLQVYDPTYVQGTASSWRVTGYPGSVHVGDVVPISTSPASEYLTKYYGKAPAGGDSYAVLPVARRVGAHSAKVVGFVSYRVLTRNYDGETTCDGIYIPYMATPDQFAPSTTSGNRAYGPRLVRP